VKRKQMAISRNDKLRSGGERALDYRPGPNSLPAGQVTQRWTWFARSHRLQLEYALPAKQTSGAKRPQFPQQFEKT
jgi:hypothetical protein